MMPKIITTQIKSPVGTLLAGVSELGLCLLEFSDEKRLAKQIPRLKEAFGAELKEGQHSLLSDLKKQLKDYFAGTLQDFELPLDMRGTDFQKQAWKALLKIPYGQTRSYLEQAISIANPKAVRALGMANGSNRISIVVPCHRVIGKDGSLTGYGGGLEKKRFLLKLESPQVELFDGP